MRSKIMDDMSQAGESVSNNSQITAVREAVAEKIGRQKFKIWFENSTELILTDDCLKILVPNSFVAEWIENHFSKQISQAVYTVTGQRPRLIFKLDQQLAGRQRCAKIHPQAKQLRHGIAENSKNRSGSSKKLKLTLDSFVVGSSNQLAYNAAKTIVNEQKSMFNPLFIHGGYGVGKTHLMQGICNEVNRCQPKTNWMYLSAEDFANQFVMALKTRKLDVFRRRIRRTDLLAIDDIHFLASKPSTQEEFLYTFNTIDLAGKQIVLVSDAHPKMIGQLSDKLVNRFVSGMVVKIGIPDLKTRCEICRRYTERLGKHMPENVIRYIAENLRTNVRELEGALLKLVAFSSINGGKVNLSMAKDVLAEHLARTDPMVQLSDIESAAADYFKVTPARIHSSKKDRTVTLARHFSMYLARKYTGMSFSEVGRCMGNKNHATVLLACRKVEDNIRKNAQLNWKDPAGNRVDKAKNILASLEKNIGS